MPYELLPIVGGRLLNNLAHLGAAVFADFGVDLARQTMSCRTRPGRVGEDVPSSKINFIDKGYTFRKFLLCLTWKSSDDIGGDGNAWDRPARLVHQLSVGGWSNSTAHALERGGAARLQGQVQVAAKA